MAAYFEVYGWPVVKWDQGECDAERKLVCFWDDVLEVLTELDAAPGWPWQAYPQGAADALIRTASVEGIGRSMSPVSSPAQSYKWAYITCHYSTRGPKYHPDYGFIEERVIVAGESFAVDVTDLRWASDSTQVKEGDAPHNHRDLLEYQIDFSNVLSVPAWVLTRQGACNLAAFATATLGITFAAQTLKYIGCTIVGKYSLGYLPRYNVTAKFAFRAPQWNKHWRAGKSAWEAVKTKDGADYVQHIPMAMSAHSS